MTGAFILGTLDFIAGGPVDPEAITPTPDTQQLCDIAFKAVKDMPDADTLLQQFTENPEATLQTVYERAYRTADAAATLNAQRN